MSGVWTAVAQFSYFLMFLGLCAPNLELLQKFFLSGSLLAVIFSFGSDREPLWVPFSWHLVFLLLSGTYVIRTGIKKRKDQLDPLEKFLKERVFPTFSVEELRSFMRYGMEGGAARGDFLFKAGAEVREITCILQGSVEFFEENNKLMDLEAGRILGITGFLGILEAQFDVAAANDIKVMVWTNSAIEQWIGHNVKRLHLIRDILGSQLVHQILLESSARKKLAEKLEREQRQQLEEKLEQEQLQEQG